jgi:hypothetical protein
MKDQHGTKRRRVMNFMVQSKHECEKWGEKREKAKAEESSEFVTSPPFSSLHKPSALQPQS